jgi:hypothetical protein
MGIKRKQMVTIYGIGISGQVFKQEGNLDSHGRTDSIAGNYLSSYGGGAPYVRFSQPPKRTLMCLERGDGPSRYLLILDGINHPKPIHLSSGTEDHCLRDFRLLAPWEELINAHIAKFHIQVIGDYRDILNDSKLRRAIWVDEQRYGRGRPRPDLADVADPGPAVTV